VIVQDSQQLEMNSAFEIATVALFPAVLAVDAKVVPVSGACAVSDNYSYTKQPVLSLEILKYRDYVFESGSLPPQPVQPKIRVDHPDVGIVSDNRPACNSLVLSGTTVHIR